MFRNAPTEIQSFSWTDPFGPSGAQITFPQITILEAAGQGDLKWFVPNANVDIIWRDRDGKPTDWVWEGYFASETISGTSRSMACRGALLQADNFLAQPQVQVRPVPLEHVIRDAFDPAKAPSLRTKPLRTTWPDEWPVIVEPADLDKEYTQLVPLGVKVGDRWSGYATRDTGSWANKLALVQEKLRDMIAPDGSQWTVSCHAGRQPVLHVRQQKFRADAATFHVTAGAPGVDISDITRDFSQIENVIYGAGKGLDGQTYSNMQIASNGTDVYYEPFAALPYVYPATDTNPAFDPGVMRREVQASFDDGLDHAAALRVAKARHARMADPGYAGTITLTTDPMRDGQPISRFLIRAGDTIQVHGLLGKDILFHITEATVSIKDLTVSLTIDSKYRDAVTVDEVRNRTRDSLDPIRALQLGKFQPAIQDLILPWSYKAQAGCMPYEGYPVLSKSNTFPWTDQTTKYPPKTHPGYYVKIPKLPADQRDGKKPLNANDRWAKFKVYVGQAGTIRLSQVAFYDRNGNLIPTTFHLSLYKNNGVDVLAMPAIPDTKLWANDTRYAVGQRYPFFKNAWETVDTQGVQFSEDAQYVTDATQQSRVVGWGNHVERAGFSPGQASALGANKTGKLIDESQWAYDTTSGAGVEWTPYDVEAVRKAANQPDTPAPGWLYGMVFADDIDDDIYMLGRLYRLPEA